MTTERNTSGNKGFALAPAQIHYIAIMIKKIVFPK